MKAILLTLTALTFTSASLIGAEMDEKQFQKAMKEIADTGKKFKANIEAKDSAQLSKDAARVSQLYNEMIAFWKARKQDEAVKWTQQSAAAAAGIAAAAKANNWDQVSLHAQNYGKNCKACHDKHREKLEDGSYRIK